VHVKLIVVDLAIAIISSMNFYAESSAGASWEAGLVSIDHKVVSSIANSFYKVLADIRASGFKD
jgi:phosphatidylserine/phosphatidylglycerophosphate/cardiolipin synthase-like enzyme